MLFGWVGEGTAGTVLEGEVELEVELELEAGLDVAAAELVGLPDVAAAVALEVGRGVITAIYVGSASHTQ